MRILADENVSGDVVVMLRERGHDVLWVRTDAPGSPDGEILEIAQAQGRLLITFDKDFGELAFRWGLPSSSGIILVRIRVTSPSRVVSIILSALESRDNWTGHFSVVEDDRIRMVPLPRYLGG